MKKTILMLALLSLTLWSNAQTQEPVLAVDEKVDCGSDFTLTATSVDDSKYHFVKWSDEVTTNPRTFTDIQEALTLTAIFAHNDLTITFVVDDNIGEVHDAEGNPISSIDIPFGESKKVKAVAKDKCYEFAGWFKSGEQEPFETDDELEIEGVEDLTIEARFVKKQFEVKVSLDAASTGMGTITLSKVE